MADYKFLPNGDVRRNSDGATVPTDALTADSLAYQAWLTQGNTPDPADAVIKNITITARQFFISMAAAGYITGAEALAAAQNGTVPSAVQTIFNSLPDAQKLAAEITWAKMTQVERHEPLVLAFAQIQGLTDAQVDAFFAEAAQI